MHVSPQAGTRTSRCTPSKCTRRLLQPAVPPGPAAWCKMCKREREEPEDQISSEASNLFLCEIESPSPCRLLFPQHLFEQICGFSLRFNHDATVPATQFRSGWEPNNSNFAIRSAQALIRSRCALLYALLLIDHLLCRLSPRGYDRVSGERAATNAGERSPFDTAGFTAGAADLGHRFEFLVRQALW